MNNLNNSRISGSPEQVVKVNKQNQIAIVTMEEKEFGNTFTSRFIQGLMGAFAAVDRDPDIKVAILTGYDNYFCCGGTKDELIGLHEGIGKKQGEGKVQFTDMNFHDLLIRCEKPVVAAMQGHALGAGLAIGCSADIIVMAEQCIYSANFMKYGFTPGFGASYIIPAKLGTALGNEMLLTARNYYGRELKERGAAANIVSKSEVMPTALAVAKELADKPLVSLKVLKKHLNRHMATQYTEAINAELKMHEITFVLPEVRQRIEGRFGS